MRDKIEDSTRILANELTEIRVDSDEEYSSADWFQGLRYLISNEDYTHNHLPERLESLKDRVADKIHVAIISGEGHFLSLVPIFARKVNLVIFYDINPLFLAHMKIMIESMRTSQNIAEFYAIYLNEAKKQFDDRGDLKPESLKSSSIAGVGGLSFLSDEERFALCKENLEKIETAYFCANLLNLKHVQRLTECLAKSTYPCVIELLNINNLSEYCKEEQEKRQLQTSVNILTRFNRSEEEPNAMILYSGMYKGELMATLATCGLNAKYVSQATYNPDLEQMEIAQHDSLQYDPFDMSCSVEERLSRMFRFSELLGLTLMPPPRGVPTDDSQYPPSHDQCAIS